MGAWHKRLVFVSSCLRDPVSCVSSVHSSDNVQPSGLTIVLIRQDCFQPRPCIHNTYSILLPPDWPQPPSLPSPTAPATYLCCSCIWTVSHHQLKRHLFCIVTAALVIPISYCRFSALHENVIFTGWLTLISSHGCFIYTKTPNFYITAGLNIRFLF